jgi:thiol-disulfide isomerase/thioredoxin
MRQKTAERRSLSQRKGINMNFSISHSTRRRRAAAAIAAWSFLGVFSAENVIAAPPTAEAALGLQPVQTDVRYQKPTAEEAARCKVVDIKMGNWTGWAVQTTDGTPLRRFADTDGDKKVDLWCYFDQGVETYRDIDADHNGKADQYRWLGTAGTRWGLDDNEDGKIDRWRQISPEEVTSEVVAALATKDAARFGLLLASDSDLKAVGLGDAMLKRLSAKSAAAASGFAAFAKDQTQVTESAKWVQFASSTPGVVPQGTDEATKDIKVYENAVAMFDDAEKGGQLLVGTIIQVNEAWRLVDLPQVVAEDQPLAQSAGIFFNASAASGAMSGARGAIGAETQELVAGLETIDRKLAVAKTAEEKAELNSQRVDMVEKLISTSADDVERETWMRQLVDTVSVAVQNGSYPDGLERLQKFSSGLPAEETSLQPYVKFQIISTEYVKRQTPDADFAKVQEWYLEELTKFVDAYPSSPEAAQALLQLALSKEFEEKEKAALEYYTKVASSFAGTDAAEKAAGAVRRLESEGKSIVFRGRAINGEAFDLAKLAGRPVIIQYWATWCDACKQDMKLLRQLQAKYQKTGLTIVGVNVDSTREDAAAYLKENPAPWIHLYEDGGLESSGLAKQLGVQTLPLMMLIDASGKVVSNNIYAASLDAELARLAKPAAPAAPAAKK